MYTHESIYICLKVIELYYRRAGVFYWYSKLYLFIGLYICLLHCTFVLYSFNSFAFVYKGITFCISHVNKPRGSVRACACVCVCMCVRVCTCVCLCPLCVCARLRKKSAFIVHCDVSDSITFEELLWKIRWF